MPTAVHLHQLLVQLQKRNPHLIHLAFLVQVEQNLHVLIILDNLRRVVHLVDPNEIGFLGEVSRDQFAEAVLLNALNRLAVFLEHLLHFFLLFVILVNSSRLNIDRVNLVDLVRALHRDLVYFPNDSFQELRSHQIANRIREEKLLVISLSESLKSHSPVDIGRQIRDVYFVLASNGSFNGPPRVQPEPDCDLEIGNGLGESFVLVVLLYVLLSLQSVCDFEKSNQRLLSDLAVVEVSLEKLGNFVVRGVHQLLLVLLVQGVVQHCLYVGLSVSLKFPHQKKRVSDIFVGCALGTRNL